jgi:hypothetical protein
MATLLEMTAMMGDRCREMGTLQMTVHKGKKSLTPQMAAKMTDGG